MGGSSVEVRDVSLELLRVGTRRKEVQEGKEGKETRWAYFHSGLG